MSASQALCGFTTLHSILQGTAKIVEAIVAKLHQLSPPGKKATKAAQALSQLLKYPVQAERDIIMNKRNSMDKIHFLRILGIMKRMRMEYEKDCVFHWHYKLHYSTKWMGVDKSAVIVLDLKKCPMPKIGSSSDEEKLEAERLMSFNHPMVQRLGCREAEVLVPRLHMPSETATAETFRHYNQKKKNNFEIFKIIKNKIEN